MFSIMINFKDYKIISFIIILIFGSLVTLVSSGKRNVWNAVDVNDDNVIEAALFAANVLSDRENSIYHKKLIRIYNAQKHVVSGIKYKIGLEMATTNCRKNEIQRYEIEKCNVNETEVRFNKILISSNNPNIF